MHRARIIDELEELMARPRSQDIRRAYEPARQMSFRQLCDETPIRSQICRRQIADEHHQVDIAPLVRLSPRTAALKPDESQALSEQSVKSPSSLAGPIICVHKDSFR